MPNIPKATKCQELACKNNRTTTSVYCAEHGGKPTAQRLETQSIYQTNAWRLMRTAQLSQQPLCQACLLDGQVKEAEHVDHVFRWTHIGRGAFYNNIFQSLCPQHHSHKTAKEREGIYEHYTHTEVKYYGLKDYDQLINNSFNFHASY